MLIKFKLMMRGALQFDMTKIIIHYINPGKFLSTVTLAELLKILPNVRDIYNVAVMKATHN